MYTLKKQSRFALGYFLIIAILGLILRLFQVVDFSFEYRYLVHTHSHIALLGWIYTAFSILIYHVFLKDANIDRKYNLLFWFSQITIIGMMLTFPFTGYGLFSILFSSLFIISSYILSRLVFKYTPYDIKQTYAYQCMRLALLYMILSSIGPWSLGIIMNTLGNTSDLYRNAIYFYLHFQYNGWFIMGALTLVFGYLEKNNVLIPQSAFKSFLWFINLGILATFGISLLWMQPSNLVYLISNLGGLFQLLAFGILLRAIHHVKSDTLKSNFPIPMIVITWFYFIKLLLQYIGSFPYFASVISINTDFIIGYIHWIFLGLISPLLLIVLHQNKIIKLSKTNLTLYTFGFLITEGLIFYKGVIIWMNKSLFNHYFEWLCLGSGILALSLLFIFIQQFNILKSQ